MNKSSFAYRIKQQETDQLRSSSAQRLIEKLSLIKNRREVSRKRWFWELLQNASDYNDTVNIVLEVTNDKVIFSHDGLPFEITDVFNLIRPDSNKIEDSRRKDNIGRFGSGFVSTHILSALITIKGLVKDNDNQLLKFEIDLDRRHADDKQLLINDIQKTVDQFADTSKVVSQIRKGFNTFFIYRIDAPLPSINALSYKEIDLDYLYRVLPYTLSFMPKIISVKIIDNRDCLNSSYIIKRSNKSTESKVLFNIEKSGKQIEECCMLLFSNKDCTSAIRVKDNKVMPYPKGISRLFCGLPLVGTERVGLPLIINSLRFIPTTERDGVEIDPSCDRINISIFESSVSLYSSILLYIESEEMLGGQELACLHNEYNGTYESKEFFKDHFIELFKEKLFRSVIAQNANGDFICVEDLRIPLLEGKTNKDLYNFAIKTDSEVLPKDYLAWARSLKVFEDLQYSYGDLAYSISSIEKLDSLSKTRKESESWLKECLKFLLQCDKDIFNDYEILPNQIGEFKKEKYLYVDKKLPADLKRINEQTEGNDRLAKELLNRNFNSLVNGREFTIKDLSQRIDDNIKEIYGDNEAQIPEEYESCVSLLYEWVKNCGFDEDKLLKYFPWFYPKRASLIADMMSEAERTQSLKIIRSGKMNGLSALAESSFSDEELSYIANNPDELRRILNQLLDIVDDKTYADKEEGDYGEELVWNKLKELYPSEKGYDVIWASRDNEEPRFDFEVLKGGKTFCYCDAKTTSRGLANADSIPLFLRKSQWQFLAEIKDKTPYYIARVFIGDNNNNIRFIRLTLKN